jgi:hypothetical protein
MPAKAPGRIQANAERSTGQCKRCGDEPASLAGMYRWASLPGCGGGGWEVSVPSAQRPTDVADWDQLSCAGRLSAEGGSAMDMLRRSPPKGLRRRRGRPGIGAVRLGAVATRGCGGWRGCRRCPGDWAPGGRPCGGPPAEDRGPGGQAAARAGTAGRPAAHSSTGLTQDRHFGGSRPLKAGAGPPTAEVVGAVRPHPWSPTESHTLWRWPGCHGCQRGHQAGTARR